MYEEITAEEVERLCQQEKHVSIIDVREADEFDEGHIPGAVNISVNIIQSKLNQIDKFKEHILVCHAGVRSEFAAKLLAAYGYHVKNMMGGMIAWNGQIVY
ncbi:rhodanese-like domain-containing protein [Sporolactobacillus shoreicorticis]|uniref:Rhodanese-like domain-containing protein n=1 Tax=Sporolactobacillus shoreicorticis TaxID=1923877 RepID=A0ABW5S7E5_9BACL|nr:rhodanese-like domain-containing protein [Sporolactobacillus shoreicorticis]MCO7126842.1 rhodanese-like domain-containing protein [Sporolactobacillus shoreicorticis]